MTELAPYVPPGQAEIDYTWNLAAKLSKTEFVPGNLRGKPEAVLAVFLTGRELGIGPMQSLRDIYPVNGRPALMASLMVARVRGLGHRFHTLYSGDDKACVQIQRRGEEVAEPVVVFTIEDAQRAELTGKKVWQQYPKAMLWNRAAAAACRRDCPEALGGATYTPEEIEDGASTTATWGAPEQLSDPVPVAPPGAGSDPTSVAWPPPGGWPPDPTSAAPSGPGKPPGGAADPTHPAAAVEEGDAIPADNDGEGPDGSGEHPYARNVGAGASTDHDGTAMADPTPPIEQRSAVIAWCTGHGVNFGDARIYLANAHKSDFGKGSPRPLRSINDMAELEGDDAARALAYLEAQFGEGGEG